VKIDGFVSREVVDKLLKKANPVWQLVLGLSRYGGLRTPSETLSLSWEDIDWEMNRIPAALLLWSLLCAIRVATNPEANARPLRSEDWRGARELIAKHPNEPVWLAPGLIETQRLLSGNDPSQIAYLTFPFQGPYPLDRVEPISLSPGAVDDLLRKRLAAGHPWWAVLRASPRQRCIDWASDVTLRAGGATKLSFESHPFGRLTLIRFTPRP
jgi:integrase